MIAEIEDLRTSEVVAELREVEARMTDLRERTSAARNVLARTRITAPVAGTVVNLRVFTRGGVIGDGDALLDIVPADEELVIEARVEPTDIDTVHADLPAQVRLTAFSHLTTPILSGTVLQVSADRLLDVRTGEPYYEARVVLDPAQPALAGLKLQPGMPAEVMILTGKRTTMDYLLKTHRHQRQSGDARGVTAGDRIRHHPRTRRSVVQPRELGQIGHPEQRGHDVVLPAAAVAPEHDFRLDAQVLGHAEKREHPPEDEVVALPQLPSPDDQHPVLVEETGRGCATAHCRDHAGDRNTPASPSRRRAHPGSDAA